MNGGPGWTSLTLAALGENLPLRFGPVRPTPGHLPVARYVPPEEFDELRREGQELGFDHVEAGPLVRSSYHARDHYGTPGPAAMGASGS